MFFLDRCCCRKKSYRTDCSTWCSAAVKRSRNVDLRGFQIDQSSFRCSVLSRGSATAQATVTMTFSITEQPARHEPDGMPLIAGFILLATSDTGVAFGRSMIAGRVALVRGGVDRRVYVATLELVHIGGVWTIELYYRHEDVHFWDRNESLKVVLLCVTPLRAAKANGSCWHPRSATWFGSRRTKRRKTSGSQRFQQDIERSCIRTTRLCTRRSLQFN